MHGPNELDPTLAALAEGQRVFGRFTLVRALGRGTLGVVWMARDEAQNRDVELKFLPEVLARDVVTVADLKLEVERVRDLRHDVFQAIYDFHEDGTRAAVSSELVPGNTLGALCEVRFNGCFDAAELLPWIEPLAEAFTLAHRQQLVHRAVHPGHLVLTPAGRVKVLDFGIAHALHEASMRRCADKSENATLTYASPQLAAGALPSPEDDVYSLGATLYDLLAGAPPFTTGATMPIAARRAALDRWGAPVPSAWEKVISSCFAKDPAKRPQSIASVIQALREGLNSEPAPARIERAEKKVEPPAAEPESPVEVPLPKTPAVPIAPKVVAEKREEPAAPPVAPVPATRPTSAPVAATLPEVEAARAIQVQRAHHRGVLVALVCLAAAWLAARTMSERGLPPVLPEAPTPPPLRAKGTPVPDSPKLESAPPVVPIPPPATPAPLPAKPEPAPPPATPTPPEPVPTVPVPPPATPTPLPPTPSAATPAPMPIAPTPPPATPAPPPTTPTPATPAPGPRRAEPVPSSTPPKLGARWTNSAGMPFAPVPKIPVLVAIWETRVRDYAAFARATGLPWKAPADGPECPVGNVSYMDALLFCDWLTTTEEAAGRLKPGQHFRLPTDAEWSAAAGIAPEAGSTLRERDDASDKAFPWGADWPPPPGAGNFRGFNPTNSGATTGTNGDIYERLAPVGSFDPNRHGIFDLAGNAAEMVSDFIAPELGLHATRGGSFRDDTEQGLRSRARGVGESDRRSAPYIGFRIVLDPAAAN